jgi:hypothetical protein
MTRRITAIAVAIVLAAFGAAGGLFLILTADKRAQDKLHDGVSVMVATSDIAAGTSGATIRSRNLATAKQFPKAIVDDSALAGLDPSYDNLVLQTTIPNGTILLQTNFGRSTRSANGLALGPGKIGMWLQTGTPAQAASNIHAGDYVIITGYSVQQTSGGAASSVDVIIDRVQLLAVTPLGGTLLITVGVTQDEMVQLIQAKNRGTLYIGLRNDISPNGG